MERPGRCCILVLVGLGAVACTSNPPDGGPLPVRNQHPAQLTVLHQAPASARVLDAGRVSARVDAAYTSLFLSGNRAGDSFTMDGEYLRVSHRLRAGLGAGLELGLELPFAHASGGFLDSFIIDYHELFGFPDQNRSNTPRDRFEVRAVDNGSAVFELDRHGAELLDVPLQLTWQLLAATADRPGLAVRGAIELPTGDDERGYGSGQVDYGIGLLAEHRTGAVAWYGHLQHTFAGTPGPARRRGFGFADVTSMGLAAELPLAADLAALVQLEWETSTLRELNLAVATRDQLLLWVGGRWQASADWSVEVGFGEDLQTLVSPDFTAWLGVVWLPGGSRLPR